MNPTVPSSQGSVSTEVPPATRGSRRSSGGVTLADVARRAGVSPITVSRVLNRPELVTGETLDAVMTAVAETGYVPNLLAGGLASARTRLVAAVIPSLGNAMFIDTVQTLNDDLSQAGYQLMLALSGNPAGNEEDLLKTILSRRPDAMILTGVSHSDATRRHIAAARLPVVEIWDLADEPLDMLVGFSHRLIGGAVFSHLYSRGYRHFALLHAGDERARVRAQAFETAAALMGGVTVIAESVGTPTTLGMGRDGLARLLAFDHPIDAVFCSSDVLALGVLAEAQSRGIRVPEQLAVMGFADLDFAAYSYPALSTVRIDRKAVGHEAVRLLLARLSGADQQRHRVDLGFSIVARAST